MASITARRPVRCYVHGPDDASITFVYACGFVGTVPYVAGLDLSGRTIQSNSAFGHLADRPHVRIVFVEHPARPISPDTDFPEIRKHLRGKVIVAGESRGAQLMGEFWLWLRQRVNPDDIGFVPISPPFTVDDLNPELAKLVRDIERRSIPYWVGGPLMWLVGARLFTDRDYRRRLKENHVEFRLRQSRRSLRRSRWVVATIRALARHRGFAEPVPAENRIIVALVPGDEVIQNQSVRKRARHAFPGCRFLDIDASGHAADEINPGAYQSFWEEAYKHFAGLWGLPN